MNANVVKIAQYDGNRGLTQTQAIREANRLRLNLLPNTEFDRRLVKTDTWKSEKEVYPAWTGTLGAYGKPGKKLEKFISYTDSETKITYTFEVPAKFVGAKDIALVTNHMVDAQGRPLFEHIEKGSNDVLVKVHDESKIQVVDSFPRSDGWYLAESNGIPTGNQVNSSNPDARYLWQVDGGSYVGLAARGYDGFVDDDRRVVDLYWLPSVRLGVLGIESGAVAPAAAPEIKSNGQPNIKELAVSAENALNSIVGKVDEVFIQPIRALVDAAKQ